MLLLALVAILSAIPVVRDSELRLVDTFFRLAPPPAKHSSVVLVLIDDESLRLFGRWPWSRQLLAKLVHGVAESGAGVIGLDVLLSEPQTREADAALADALKTSGRVVIVSKVSSFRGGAQWVEPLPAFSASAAAVGHAHAVLDEDSVCRSFPPLELTIDGPRWAFSVEVARRVNPQQTSSFLRSYGVRDNDSARILSARPVLARVPFRRDGFDTISAATVLSGSNLPISLNGRPVLIGFGAADLSDRLSTPLATELPAPGIEVHAQILDGILNGRLLKDVGAGWGFVFLALTCVFVIAVFRRWRGWKSVGLLVLIAIAVYAIAFLTFLWASKILPSGGMLLAVITGPLVVYAADFALVERSLTRQLLGLRGWLTPQQKNQESTGKSDLSWKLTLLQDLETELGSLYELHKTLLESTQDLVAIFDEKGQPLLENKAFAQAVTPHGPDLTLEQLRNQWTSEADAPLTHNALGEHGEVHLNGSLFAVRIAPLPPTRLSPGGGTVVTFTNLRTRVERDRARSEALAFITHELRTPLVSIQGFADLMIRYPGSPDCEDAPQTILWESKRLLALINSYLDVLRLDAGAKPIRSDVVDLSHTINQVFDILRPLAGAANMRLVSKAEADLIVTADANLISGAILNLISNAIKYGKPGTDIEVSCSSANDNQVAICVRNQGNAIAAGDIPHLFDPYYRTRDVEHAKPGWGLGLAFVKRIVEKHGGSVQARSEPSGTIFEIRLPAAVEVRSEVK
jgi:signal transduction histidine kinase